MCGIGGYVLGRESCKRPDLEAMSAVIRHRGPDGEGQGILDRAGLVHRRLAIIDLVQGQQPMRSSDGRYWIVFNGEIYNYRDLRRSHCGEYEFRTKSDTEVILALYARYGERCVRFLRGMFAFAIYDEHEHRLFAARDHLGQKPFYYAELHGMLVFASEIKGLLAAMPELREPDMEAVHEYLTVRIISSPRSMFRRVRKLPPGHTLTWEDGRVSTAAYWCLDYTRKRSGSLADIVDELDSHVDSAVRHHLVSDVEVGSFLSGGLDSSMIVAYMSRHQRAFRTFSGDVQYAGFSEAPYARLVSETFATNHHLATFSPSLVEDLPKVVWHLDEPSDSLSIAMYYLAEFVSQHVKVVLGGDGGDELFGGYDRYYGYLYAGRLAMLPGWVRERVLERLLAVVPAESWYRGVTHQLRWLCYLSRFDGAERYAKALSYFYFSDRSRADMFAPEFAARVAGFDPEGAIKEHFDAACADDVVDRMLASDARVRLPDHPVMILDRMTMSHGLEARAPFLDHELAQFCAEIPSRYKIRRRQRRIVQRALAERLLPKEILGRKKQGFNSAIPYLLSTELASLYRWILRDMRLIDNRILRGDGVRKLVKEHTDGKADHGNRLWLLLSLELWWRVLIDQEQPEALSVAMRAALSN